MCWKGAGVVLAASFECKQSCTDVVQFPTCHKGFRRKPVENEHGRNLSKAQHTFPTFASFSSLHRSHNSVSMVSVFVQGKECVYWGNVHPFKKASLTKHRFIQQGQKSAEAETELWDAGWSISVWALWSMIHQIRTLLQRRFLAARWPFINSDPLTNSTFGTKDNASVFIWNKCFKCAS